MHTLTFVTLLVVVAAASGCADNPVTPEEHFEPRGLRLSRADTVAVTVDSSRVAGALVVDTLAPVRYALAFISETGASVLPPHAIGNAVAYTLEVQIADTTIAAVASLEFDHLWSVTIVGRRAGTTTAVVRLMHGGHAELVSPAIPVVVTP